MRRAASVLLILLTALPLGAKTRAVRSGPIDTPAAWLQHQAIRFAPESDLAPFVRMIGDARVVAIGDATHGTRETYLARQRLIPELVAAGFRTIAFEAPYAEWARVDAYITRGEGDPAEAIRYWLYWFWDTDEMLDLVRWMRAQNEAGLTPPIRVVGVDSTEPRSAMTVVTDFLDDVDPLAAAEARAAYDCVHASYRGNAVCKADVESVRPKIAAKREQYALLTSPSEVDEILFAARVVEQGERNVATRNGARDEAMAENILHLADRGEKVIVAGHNEHWGRTPYRLTEPELIWSAGADLAEALGDGYFALGSILHDATFHAIDYEMGVGVIRPQTMAPPAGDDFARIFDQAGLEAMIVPMRRTLPAWLEGTHRLRFAGSVVLSRDRAGMEVDADLGAKFDAVLFFRSSTPTRVRNWPTF